MSPCHIAPSGVNYKACGRVRTRGTARDSDRARSAVHARRDREIASRDVKSSRNRRSRVVDDEESARPGTWSSSLAPVAIGFHRKSRAGIDALVLMRSCDLRYKNISYDNMECLTQFASRTCQEKIDRKLIVEITSVIKIKIASRILEYELFQP